MDKWKEYSMIHPKSGKKVSGKVFLKEATLATGTEISLDVIPPKADLSYFHIHRKNEETYMILKGYGYFQIDDDCFPVEEGSIIRVAPDGKRNICNTSDTDMIYICIQSKENSLEEHSTDDGERVVLPAKWDL
jgi:mannose-6-phosphate isomerase-like protein (cupin superfamily)